jgi:hypothetical protein
VKLTTHHIALDADGEAPRVVRNNLGSGANVWIEGVCVTGNAAAWRALAALASEAAAIEEECERAKREPHAFVGWDPSGPALETCRLCWKPRDHELHRGGAK